MEKRKIKGKKLVSLVFGIVLALAVIAGGVVAVLFMNNGFFSGQVEYSGSVNVQDEQTLRAALKSKDSCEIFLSEDVVITREMEVFGNKKISGGSIIMDMHREGSGESVLSIQKGATLVLDGTTIDGNSVVNCISVKAGGELDAQSGSLIYGYPYGLDVSGKVTITDILIDESLHTAINVAIFGEVDMLGGIISQNVYGIAVAEEGRMAVADGVIMKKSVASFIVNYGTMDISGGKYDGANDNAIENWGTMNIRGTADKPIEICNGKKSAINAKNNAKLTAEHIKIYDMGWHGMCVEKNTTATLKNIHFDTTGKSTLYVNSAKAKIENITILNGTAYGVYATKNADVTMTDIIIKDMNNRAVMNEASVLTAENLTIENSAQHGVYTTGEKAVTTVNNATIIGVERSAFAVAEGKGIITNSHLEQTSRECVSVAEPGEVIAENCTIDKVGNFAIASYGGVATAKNVTINNTGNSSVKIIDGGNFTGDGLTISNSAKQAISIENGATAKVTNCKINTTQAASVYVDNSSLTMKASVINNSKTYGVAAKNCKKLDGNKVQLDGITVNNPGEHGIGSINSYMVAANIKVTGSRRCGIYSEGDQAIINMAWIEVYRAGTCGLGFKGAAEITARNVIIDKPGKEGIYATSGAIVKKLDNITIKNPGTHGLSVDSNATVMVTVDTKYNPENKDGNGVMVLNPGKNGIRVVEGKLSAVGVKIENAKQQGISVEKAGNLTVDGCIIDTTAKAAVYAHESSLTLKNATINNAGSVAIAAKDCKKADGNKVQLSNITIDTTAQQGIANYGSYVLPSHITIKNSGQASIYTEGDDSYTNMNQIQILNAGSCGFGFNGGAEITARNVTIIEPKNEGIIVKANANVKKLDNVKIVKSGKTGMDVQSGTVTITADTSYNPENTAGNGITIENAGKYGINISKGATVNATAATIINSAERAISSGGTLQVKGMTIDTTGGHGIYLAADASISGSDLTIRNTGDNGIFSEGAPIEITGFTLENTKNQGVQVKGGTVDLSNVSMKEIGGVAVRVRNEAKVTLTGGTILADTYAIYCDGTTETIVSGVTVERAGEKRDALADVSGNAKLEITGGTKLDNKNLSGHALAVESANAVLILNGGSLVGEAEGYTDVLLNEDGASVSLGKKLTESVSLKVNQYTSGRVVANKHDNISDADFEASMELLVPDDSNWTINQTGCLSAAGEAVATIGSVGYTTLEDAVAAAHASATGATITVLKDVTVANQLQISKDVTITADKVVTITADLSGGMFNVTTGTLTITGSSETEKIILASGTKTTNIVYVDGGNVNLTNVELLGNTNSEAGTNSTYGIYVNAGKATAKSVTIKDIPKGDGINIRAGASADLDNVTISNTGRYGIKTYGTVNIYNTVNASHALTIQNTYDHAIDIDNTGKVLSHLSNVPAETYAITIDTTNKSSARGILIRGGAELSVTDIRIQNVKSIGVELNVATSVASISNATIDADSYAIKTAADSTLTVSNVVVQKCGDSAASIAGTVNGTIAFTHNVTHAAAVAPDYENDGNIEYWHCSACGTVWKDEARTQVITIGETVLPKLESGVASVNGVQYPSLEAAITAAAQTDTIKILEDLSIPATIQISKDVTITADKALTITADLSGGMFNVTTGTLTIAGSSETEKIILVSGTKTTNIVYVDGGNVNLTNVELLGNTNSEAGTNSTYGIYVNAGKATAKSVTIKDIPKGDGINIRAGASADLDNVTISNTGRYGIKTYGTVNIYNTVNASHALTIQNTHDHAIDIDNAGSVNSDLKDVPENTYAIQIDTTTKSSARGILVRAGGSVNLTNISIRNTRHHGLDVLTETSSGTLSHFEIVGTGDACLNEGGTVTLKNGVLHPDNGDVYLVDAEGNRVKVEAILGGEYYTSLEDAITGAEAGSTIQVVGDATVEATVAKPITLTADKAVTITADLSGGMFNVTTGTLTITGPSETEKITLASGTKTTNIIYVNGGNVNLTNVELRGNTNSEAGKNSTYGIYVNAGKATAKSVTITDITKGDGINVRAGASADLDNVSISNTGRYGIKTYGTVNIYNTVNASHALTIQNTVEHGIDIDNAGAVNSTLTNVPDGTYAITIDTATKSNAIGILVRAGGEVNVSHISITNVQKQGVYFYGTSATKTASGSISDFAISKTGDDTVELAYSTATLTNGTVDKAVVKDANSTLTATNVTVQG